MKSTVQYKCPDCGGSVHYDPNTRTFACDWCYSFFTKEQLVGNEDLADDDDTPNYADELDVYVCASCGAEIVCDHNTSATFCCYCHSPVSLKGRLSGVFRPEYIIPFNVDKDKAIEFFKGQFKSDRFADNGFLSDAQLETMKGLYVPFWMIDCDIHTRISGTATAVDPKTAHSEYADLAYINYRFTRGADISFSKIPIVASERINDGLMNSIEPYSYSQLREFSMSYLAGFYAEKFDVSPDSLTEKLVEKLKPTAEEVVKRKSLAIYDSLDIRRSQTEVKRCDWHYVLLPVWFMSYKSGKDTFFFAVNGQTGKSYGKYPLSMPKVVLFGVIMGFIAAAFFRAALDFLSLQSTADYTVPIAGIIGGIAAVCCVLSKYRNYKKIGTEYYVKFSDADITERTDTRV